MATAVWSTVLDHSSTAGFDAWASELFTQLTTVNASQLTQTADTGQLATPVVAARPATNTAAGYWIFKWTDGSSTDLYFKIEVGTGSAAAAPMIWITVGTGSNGSGTLTGSVTTRSQCCANSAPNSTATNYTSYLCCATGAFSLAWKTLARGASSAGMGFFSTAHSVDDNGAVNNDGYLNMSLTAATSYQLQSVNLTNSVVFSNAAASNLNGVVCIIPFSITSSVVSGNAQYFRCFAAYPLARPIGHVVTCISNEFAVGTSFAGESGSITDHTFLSLGAAGGFSNYAIAILWQ